VAYPIIYTRCRSGQSSDVSAWMMVLFWISGTGSDNAFKIISISCGFHSAGLLCNQSTAARVMVDRIQSCHMRSVLGRAQILLCSSRLDTTRHVRRVERVEPCTADDDEAAVLAYTSLVFLCSGFASVSGTTSGKSEMDMSTPVHAVATTMNTCRASRACRFSSRLFPTPKCVG